MRTWQPMGFAVLAGLSGAANAGWVQPGQWQATTIISAVDMPGAPPGIAQMMKGHPTTTSYCITPEQAEKDPRAIMGTQKQCTIKNFSMAGGKLASTTVCQDRSGTMTIDSAGSYTPTGYTATSHIVRSGEGAMNMTASVSAKLTGPCKK